MISIKIITSFDHTKLFVADLIELRPNEFTNQMAPVGHEVPTNVPIHNPSKTFSKMLLPNSARFIVETTIANTNSFKT